MIIYKRKIQKCILIFLLLIIMLFFTAIPVFAESPSVNVNISVVNTVTNVEEVTNNIYTYIIKPETSDAPMPDKAEIVLYGNQSGSFGMIKYSAPGVYSYDIALKESSNAYADISVYHVTVYILSNDKGELSSVVTIIKNGSGYKTDSVLYSQKETINPSVSPDSGPKTGDTSKVLLYIIAMILSAGCIAVVMLITKKKHEI